jgi:hypothetical protein
MSFLSVFSISLERFCWRIKAKWGNPSHCQHMNSFSGSELSRTLYAKIMTTYTWNCLYQIVEYWKCVQQWKLRYKYVFTVFCWQKYRKKWTNQIGCIGTGILWYIYWYTGASIVAMRTGNKSGDRCATSFTILPSLKTLELWDLKYFSCCMVHQGISRRVLRGATYDPGHWTFYFVEGDLA